MEDSGEEWREDEDDAVEEDYDNETFNVQFSEYNGENWLYHGGPVPNEFTVMLINGRIDPNDEKFSMLLNILHKDPRRWSRIIISGPEELPEVSPAFLSLLVSTFSKTDELSLNGCMNAVTAFACLKTGLIVKNGVKELSVWNHPHRPMTEQEVEALSQGLSFSTSLESLRLPWNLTNGGRALVQGLQTNQSLLALELVWCKFEDNVLSKLLSTLQSHPRLKKLEMRVSRKEASRQNVDALSQWLGRADCKLESLCVSASEDSEPLPQLSDCCFREPNTSVKNLCLPQNGISSSILGSFLSKFSTLVSLNLSENQISDLTPLENSLLATSLISLDLSENLISNLEPLHRLLCGNQSKLEVLYLNHNRIGVEDIQQFAPKLSQMGTVRTLLLFRNPFTRSVIAMSSLVRCLQTNTSLGMIDLFSVSNYGSVAETFASEIAPVTSINRGG